MNPAGQLHIKLRMDKDRISALDISSSRPHNLGRLFSGKTMPQVLASLPLLYGVCRTGQQLAAWRAWQMALGGKIDPEILKAQQQLVALENLREHLLRIKLGWSGHSRDSGTWLKQTLGQLGQVQAQADTGLFLDGSALSERPRLSGQSLQGSLDALTQSLSKEVFGCSLQDWAAMDRLARLLHWLGSYPNPVTGYLQGLMDNGEAGLGDSHCPWLPELDRASLHGFFVAPDAKEQLARPRWQGQCQETGPLARQHQHPLLQALMRDHGRGLLVRAVARLLDVVSQTEKMQQTGQLEAPASPCRPVPEAIGIGQVETARGRLVHWLRLEQGLVAYYHILAPTEWNCHPEGTLAEGLMALGHGSPQELGRRAGMLIEAIDPCVGWQLEFLHA